MRHGQILVLVLIVSLTVDESWARGPAGRAAGAARGRAGANLAGPGKGSPPGNSLPRAGNGVAGDRAGPLSAGGTMGASPTLAPAQRRLGNASRAAAVQSLDASRAQQGLQPGLQGLQDHLRVTAGQARQQLSSAFSAASQRPEPFTPAWYAQHPNAWKATHPHADAAVVASVAALSAWLAVPVTTSTGSTETIVVVEDEAESAAAETDPASLAATSPTAAPDASSWMPIGSFAVRPSDAKESHRFVQLSVNRDGEIRGSYFDQVSDSVESVAGYVDKPTLTATWVIGVGGVSFSSRLAELTKPEGTMTATFADGHTATWHIGPLSRP